MKIEFFFLVVAVSAGITFFLRALPFLAFRGEREMPEKLIYLGKILPSAIMAVLIVYCLKETGSDFSHTGIANFLAVAVVAVSYKWKHNTFLSTGDLENYENNSGRRIRTVKCG